MSPERFTDCVRLGDVDRQRLFEALELAEQQPEQNSKRIFERTAFYGHEIPLTTFGGDQRETHRFMVLSRNMSASGISILHGGFIYPESKCELILKTLDGEYLRVRAEVMHCRLVKGRVHEIGLRFEKLIEPESYIENVFCEPLRTPTHLAGTVLAFEEHAEGFDRLRMCLGDIGLTLQRSETIEKCIEAIKARKPGVLWCDLDLEGDPEVGILAIRQIRDSGYDGTIIAATSSKTPAQIQRSVERGATDVVLKPLEPEQVLHVFATHLSPVAGEKAA